MRATNWNNHTSNSEAARRAGGRRHYNAIRQAQATERRLLLRSLITELGRSERGFVTATAKALGVDKSTISRDLKALAMPKPVIVRYVVVNGVRRDEDPARNRMIKNLLNRSQDKSTAPR